MDIQGMIDEALRLGKGGAPVSEHCGLCWHVSAVTDWGPVTLSGVLCRAFKAWPEFSGDGDYPIPHAGWAPWEAYEHCKLWEGEYGESRRRLCLHVAQYLTDHVEEFQ